MPSKRTGLMPAKKKFTAVGGVGARHIAMQNKISVHASRVAYAAPPPPPPPVPEPVPLDNLFNIDSFSNTFAEDVYPGFSETHLDPFYVLALTAATSRWNNFLSFHPHFVSIVKEKYKEMFGKEWKGFELVALNYSLPSHVIATARPLTFIGTDMPYAFRLGANKDKLKFYSQKNIEHVFAHELGHVIGIVNPSHAIMLPDKFDPLNPTRSYYVPMPKPNDIPNFKCMIGYLEQSAPVSETPTFPETYEEYHKLMRHSIKFSILVPPYIMLSDDGKHWKENMISHEIYEWYPALNTHILSFQHNYGNFFNELMTSTFNDSYDDEVGYLISSKSLKYLTESTVGNNVKMYVEKNPGASEVEHVLRTGVNSNYKYVLVGKAGVIVPANRIIPIISVERTLSRDTDATYATHCVIYPEGYNGDCNDEEIIQFVKKHERIVNDPAYNSVKCCSQNQ